MTSDKITSLDDLKTRLARPSDELINDLNRLDGDLMLLGVGGKMGPSLARLARNALDQLDGRRRVIGVSRFSSEGLREELESDGIETVRADLLDETRLKELPSVQNIVYLVGRKFGTSGRKDLTWAINSYLPGRVASRWKDSRIVALSTGNVYPMVPITEGGPTEEVECDPVGEYAQSCLGRERVFEYVSRTEDVSLALIRLNYAIDLRYGVLHDVATQVYSGNPVDLSMSQVNVIWQGDANEMILRSLLHTDSPPNVLNVTGPETISVKWMANEFADRFGTEPVFSGEPEPTALLNNAARAHQLFGYPRVPLERMIDWTAHWIEIDGPTHDKPTHFQEREGEF